MIKIKMREKLPLLFYISRLIAAKDHQQVTSKSRPVYCCYGSNDVYYKRYKTEVSAIILPDKKKSGWESNKACQYKYDGRFSSSTTSIVYWYPIHAPCTCRYTWVQDKHWRQSICQAAKPSKTDKAYDRKLNNISVTHTLADISQKGADREPII